MKLRLPGRRNAADTTAPAAPDDQGELTAHLVRSAGKGRPTPRRSEAQGRRPGPPPPPPTTRREAYRRMREQQASRRGDARQAAARGDDAFLPARDRGPVRRAVRDLVDSRRNVAVLMLPFALTLIVVQLVVGQGALLALFYRAWTLVVLLVIADLVLLALLVRRAVRAAFPQEQRTRGHVGYALLRSTSFRRLRMPSPRVRPKGLLGR